MQTNMIEKIRRGLWKQSIMCEIKRKEWEEQDGSDRSMTRLSTLEKITVVRNRPTPS